MLQPPPADYKAEPAATAAAAVLAANAAAAAAAEEARRRSIERGAAGITLGKRKRKPKKDEDYVDPNSEEDEELKGAGPVWRCCVWLVLGRKEEGGFTSSLGLAAASCVAVANAGCCCCCYTCA